MTSSSELLNSPAQMMVHIASQVTTKGFFQRRTLMAECHGGVMWSRFHRAGSAGCRVRRAQREGRADLHNQAVLEEIAIAGEYFNSADLSGEVVCRADLVGNEVMWSHSDH